jgi:hypothetical protein
MRRRELIALLKCLPLTGGAQQHARAARSRQKARIQEKSLPSHLQAEAVAEAISTVAHRGDERRHLSSDRRHGLAHLRCRPPRYVRRTGSQHSGLSRGLSVGRSRRTRRGLFASPDLCCRDRSAGTSRPRASIMQFYRTLGLQLEGAAKRPGMGAGEEGAERGQALKTISYVRMRCAIK